MSQKFQRYNEPKLGQRIVGWAMAVMLVVAVVLALRSGQDKLHGLGVISAIITLLPASIGGLAALLYWRSSRIYDRRRGWAEKA